MSNAPQIVSQEAIIRAEQGWTFFTKAVTIACVVSALAVSLVVVLITF